MCSGTPAGRGAATLLSRLPPWVRGLIPIQPGRTEVFTLFLVFSPQLSGLVVRLKVEDQPARTPGRVRQWARRGLSGLVARHVVAAPLAPRRTTVSVSPIREGAGRVCEAARGKRRRAALAHVV